MEYMGFEKMSLEEFAQEVREGIANYLLDRNIESIRVEKVTKNNGVELTGIVILEQGENAAPNLYMNSYYNMYQKGSPMEEILKSIAADYRDATAKIPDLEMSHILTKENLFVKLVNYEANKNTMAHRVFEKYMDMAFVVRLKCEETENGLCSTALDLKLLGQLGISYDEAIKVAKENTIKQWPTKIVPMTEILGMELDEDIPEDCQMFVVTNSTGINGATALIDTETISAYFGDKDMYMIPSSIHEVIFTSYREGDDRKLSALVKEVNSFVVSKEEKLSDNVYKYDGQEKTIIQCTGLDKSKNNPERDM